jgi:adenosylmethionine-8-amino-7-oxononanoate aminotransferase
LWNVNLGFSCEPVKQAIAEQLDRLPYYSIFRGTTNDVAVELSYELAQFFEPDGLQRAFYTSGGGDSVETALRLARQYHKIRGDAGRVKVHQSEERLSRHPYGRCQRQRERQFQGTI